MAFWRLGRRRDSAIIMKLNVTRGRITRGCKPGQRRRHRSQREPPGRTRNLSLVLRRPARRGSRNSTRHTQAASTPAPGRPRPSLLTEGPRPRQATGAAGSLAAGLRARARRACARECHTSRSPGRRHASGPPWPRHARPSVRGRATVRSVTSGSSCIRRQLRRLQCRCSALAGSLDERRGGL